MIKLKVGGVPEHFNLPWHVSLEAAEPQRLGIALEWRDYPDGSGAMAAALRSGELDAALLLTEGAVAGIAGGGGFEIVSLYTDSPLVWGIHVPAISSLHAIEDIRGRRYAISRRGSGSHIMAYVHARELGWSVDALDLVVIGNLKGAIEAFGAGAADVFFWEKFMTKPLVDGGRFRRVGEFVAPWPAFVLSVADKAGPEQRAALSRLFPQVLDQARSLTRRPDAAEFIGARYGLAAADVAEWLRSTRWSTRTGIRPEDLLPATTALGALGLVPTAFAPQDALGSL